MTSTGPKRTRMAAMADLLAESGYEPEDVTILAVVHRAVVQLVNEQVDFELIATNKDRPDHKYGTDPDGLPCYAPEWYTAMGIKTGIHEAIYGVLRELLSCEEVDEHGHQCVGSLMHSTCHWDGNGCNWVVTPLSSWRDEADMLRRCAEASRNARKQMAGAAEWFEWVPQYLDRLAERVEELGGSA